MSATPPKAILTPAADTLIIGGLSIIALLVMLLGANVPAVAHIATLGSQTDLIVVLVFGTLLNSPHFVASWILLYGSPETRTNHRWAAYGIPLALVAYCAYAFAVSTRTPNPTYLLLGVSSLYLAWHYTGQAWGMIATFAHLEGTPPTNRERVLIRGGLRIFLVWHLAWAMHHAVDLPATYETLTQASYRIMKWIGPLAMVMGAIGFFEMRRRIGRMIPIRVIVPWLAICLWYPFLARYPVGGLFWVQMSHSLQYLIFPLRVESNRWDLRKAAADAGERPAPRLRYATHMALYVLGVLALGWTIFEGLPEAGAVLTRNHLEGYPVGLIGLLLVTSVNIHHFFTDGVVWKISNPAVRRELFAHIPR